MDPEAYLELGDDYFQQTKYYEAIVLYRMFLQLYPLHSRAPSVAQRIAEAYDRQRQYDQAVAARGRLANYLEGSQWYNANGAPPTHSAWPTPSRATRCTTSRSSTTSRPAELPRPGRRAMRDGSPRGG